MSALALCVSSRGRTSTISAMTAGFGAPDSEVNRWNLHSRLALQQGKPRLCVISLLDATPGSEYLDLTISMSQRSFGGVRASRF